MVESKQRNKIIPDAQLILVRNDGQEILLQKRAGRFYHGWYGLISGHVDAGELPSETIVREAAEEAGITVKIKDLALMHVLYRKTLVQPGERVSMFFAAKTWQGEPIMCEPTKCLDLAWFKIDELPENTIPHVRHVLSEIMKTGACYSEYVDDEVGAYQ
ncbi:MAG: NUDIX hydrolase [candidate division TM6 bacterium GW2011_GWE2_41_16]|nr:MAG: NUDIX hydrolase [candidate division TM6 bacterium GW2011_GWE2_41_16]